MENDIIP